MRQERCFGLTNGLHDDAEMSDTVKSPLYMAICEAMNSQYYPKRVKIFLGGLKACLMMQQRYNGKSLEKLVFQIYRTAYELGASEFGGDIELIHQEMPDFGLDNVTNDKKR